MEVSMHVTLKPEALGARLAESWSPKAMLKRALVALAAALAACGGSGPGTGSASAGGSTSSQPTIAATDDGVMMCPLGFATTSAVANGSTMTVSASCAGSCLLLEYAPTPSPGGSASATSCVFAITMATNTPDCSSLFSSAANGLQGSVTVDGIAPNLTVNGNCSVTLPKVRSVQYSGLPLAVH
jgi:hypothetical protein